MKQAKAFDSVRHLRMTIDQAFNRERNTPAPRQQAAQHRVPNPKRAQMAETLPGKLHGQAA